jgi:hypothetical protein
MSDIVHLVAGLVFTVPHPFVREEVSLMPDDPEARVPNVIISWRPGIRFQQVGMWGESETVADGVGEQILTVVSEHRPGRYPTRVFYTRQWRSPEGKVFGKPALRIKTRSAFLALAKGYRHSFRLIDQGEAA